MTKKHELEGRITQTTRHCPMCNCVLSYKSPWNCYVAQRKNQFCHTCGGIKAASPRKNPEQLSRLCPKCNETIRYTSTMNCKWAAKKGTLCASCASVLRAQEMKKSPDYKDKMLLRGRKLRGNGNPFFGMTHSNVFRLRMSKAMSERTVSDETRKKMSELMKKRQEDPEYHKKRLATLRKNNRKYECPNKYERQLESILESLFPGQYKFVGDWSFILGRKNPDFLNVNGQKKIIELFGEVFHNPDASPWKIADDRTGSARKKHFSKFGFKTLIVWCKELGDEESLKTKLVKFHGLLGK